MALSALRGFLPMRRSVLRRYEKKVAGRSGAAIRKTRKGALWAIALFIIVVVCGAGLIIAGIGVPGRAWG